MIRSSRAATIGILVAALAVAVSWAIATRGSRRVPMTREVAREMRAGADFAARIETSLTAASAESISVADAVAQNYLERLRLGLSSPFRKLIHYIDGADAVVEVEEVRELAAELANSYYAD